MNKDEFEKVEKIVHELNDINYKIDNLINGGIISSIKISNGIDYKNISIDKDLSVLIKKILVKELDNRGKNLFDKFEKIKIEF